MVLILVVEGCAGRQPQRREDWLKVAQREAVPLSQLAGRVCDARIVILGETHALIEPIETLRTLLADTNRIGWAHAAFEWSVTDQPGLDRFMAGDDAVLDRFKQLYGQLPGATTEYIETFAFIRERNRAHPSNVIQVCAMDVPHPVRNTAEEERDRHMFDRIVALLESGPNHRVLIHCGDSHGAKCGRLAYPTRAGGKELKLTLGAQLCRRYPGKVVAIDVLSPYSPMWWQIKRESPFPGPVAIPASSRWPNAPDLGLPIWHPDSPDGSVSAKAVFDYVVWWPTSRPGTRKQ